MHSPTTSATSRIHSTPRTAASWSGVIKATTFLVTTIITWTTSKAAFHSTTVSTSWSSVSAASSKWSSTSLIHHFIKLWRNGLLSFLKHFNEIACLLCIGWSKESVRSTLLITTSSTSDAMDIIFWVIRIIVINDKLDVINIETASCYICG